MKRSGRSSDPSQVILTFSKDGFLPSTINFDSDDYWDGVENADPFNALSFTVVLSDESGEPQCPPGTIGIPPDCEPITALPIGGEFVGVDATAVLLAGTHSTAAWMIPVIVSAIGIGIVIARKF